MTYVIAGLVGVVGLSIVQLFKAPSWVAFSIGWLFATVSLMLQTFWRTGHL